MIRVAVIFMSLVYGCLMAIVTMFLYLWRGKSIFAVKNRETPPPCLQDPKLGHHAYIKLKEVKLHYVSSGDQNKTMMLMIHGFPDFWFSWRHQMKEFSREYWVVAIDLRGYGDSDKPDGVDSYTTDKVIEDLRELIYALGKEHAIVVAHDWGAVLSYMLAAKHPEVVHRLVICNGPHPKAYDDVLKISWLQFFRSWYVCFFQMLYLPEFMLRMEDLRVFELLMEGRKTSPWADEEVEAYKYTFGKKSAFTPPLHYYRAWQMQFMSCPSNFQITVPTLLVWGGQDLMLDIRIVAATSKYVDDFHLEVVEGANHFVQTYNPIAFNTCVWQFLKSSSTAANFKNGVKCIKG